MNLPNPDPQLSTEDVLEALNGSGKPLQEWGRAVDGAPLLAARSGGDKKPAILITAGAHSTETAGVHSALQLLERLDTEHEVHVLPLRDPFGFAGVNHVLSFAAGDPVRVASHAEALAYLEDHGQLVWREGALRLFRLGDVGFLWHTPRLPGVGRFITMHARMLSLAKEAPDLLRPLWGRRVMLLNAMRDVEGTGELGRSFHCLLTPRGEWMHLNRLFGREDAPAEVAALARLMQSVRPGLTCDLHEGNGQGFWMPIPRPKENPELAFEMTRAYLDYVHSRGYPITTFEEWAATDETSGKNYDSDWMRPEPRLPGLFWCYGMLRGEGYNLMDYAELFGMGYGTESPMERPLAMRVDAITNGMLAAIRVWEQSIE